MVRVGSYEDCDQSSAHPQMRREVGRYECQYEDGLVCLIQGERFRKTATKAESSQDPQPRPHKLLPVFDAADGGRQV
jgi:hypothetical protein